jgi:DNA invertase Pin-like site-specific DNA recombinase
VYDVSRWGRFQDPDESGYYEYICKRAGIRVHYCAEQFENDGTPFAAIVKAIKRAMAGEYSRELSVKVFYGHARLVKLGYSQGGAASYGLRRLLIDQHGSVKFELKPGELKNIYTDRVVLAPGAPIEVEAVRWIFEAFVQKRLSELEIAESLNQRGIPAANGRKWRRHFVHKLLRNERYIGNLVWNHASSKLKGKIVPNAPDKWIRAEGVIEPIVARPVFSAAQEIIRERLRERTADEKLEPLRKLFQRHGRLTCRLIQQSPGVPSVSSYQAWFGGLIEAYKLVGYNGYRRYRRCQRPRRSNARTTRNLSDQELLDLLRQLMKKHGYLTTKLINETEGIPSTGTYFKRFGSITQLFQRMAHLPEHPGNRTREIPTRRTNAITYNLSNDQILHMLRSLLARHGYLTQTLINANRSMPSSATYKNRFGSLMRAYRLIGYAPKRQIRKARDKLGRWIAT